MKVHFFSPPPRQRVGGLDAAIQGLRRALERAGAQVNNTMPDSRDGQIVHFHGLWQPAHAVTALKCAAKGIPFVVSPHGMLESWALRQKAWKKTPYFHFVEKHHLARASALLATGRMEAERLAQLVPRQHIVSLPLGLTGEARPDYTAAREKLGWGSDERVLLFLSRLNKKKGLDMLLQALASTPRKEKMRLVVVGNGAASYVRFLHKLSGELSHALPRVDWIGEIWGEERWPYFQGADLFCLPTFSENFGFAVLEACQVGTAVLTTTATPWAEYLDARRDFICEPTEEAIRMLLVRIFAESRRSLEERRALAEERRALAEERRALAEWAWSRFDWDALAPSYLAFYRSLESAVIVS